MPTLSQIEKTRLSALVDKILAGKATVGEELEAAFWSKKYASNIMARNVT